MDRSDAASSLKRNSRPCVYYSIIIPDMDSGHVLEGSQYDYSPPFTFTALRPVIKLSAQIYSEKESGQLLRAHWKNTFAEALRVRLETMTVLPARAATGTSQS